MMDPKEFDWYIKLVQDRNSYLNLSREQAIKIFEYERERDNFSDKHSFSAWEEWDYESTVFHEILDKDQFEKYEKYLRESIVGYENSLKESDQSIDNQLLYHQSLLDYYTQHFIPGIASIKAPVLFGLIYKDLSKRTLLKEEYKKYLNDIKKEILSSHFRHNRTFQPNLLKVSLLRHEVSYLFPDYWSFKFSMDDATKAVAHHLSSKFKYINDSELVELNKHLEELKTFQETNFKKHYGDTRGGWHVVFGETTEEEGRLNKIMSLVLFEKQGYKHSNDLQ